MFKKVHVFRIKPGQELLREIGAYCRANNVRSAVIVGLIGSLKWAKINYLLRLPGQYKSVEYAGPLEIVSGQGSIAMKDGELVLHIHAQVSNEQGCHGGHLAEAVVFSTAEVVIAELDFPLKRELDSYTGLNELLPS